MSIKLLMDIILSASNTSKRHHRRPNFPLDFKLKLVEASFAPGVSVAQLARENNLNDNVLFNWRNQYRQGKFGPISPAAAVLPVHVLPEPAMPSNEAAMEPVQIELILPKGRLRICGRPDPATLRMVIEALSTC